MTISPISPVSFSGNYNKVAFEGKKQNKEKSTLSLNPAKKLAVPLAATVIAMSNPQAVSAKELYSDINENYIAMNDTNTKYVSQNKSSNIGTPLTSKLFYPKNSTGTIRVRPFDTDNDPTTAEKLVLDIPSYDGSYDIGEVKSVGSGTLTVTGAYDSRSSKLIQYDQTEVRFDNYDTNSIFFNKELHDYILNFAQNKTNIKNNGAVKIKNVEKDLRGTESFGLQNVPIPHSWLKKASEHQFDYIAHYGFPVVNTPPIKTDNGEFIIRGYNTDSNKDTFEVLTIYKVADSEADIPYCPELEIKGIGLINGQLYDGALEKKDFQYPLVNLYCRGWDSTVSMVDIPVWNVVKQIHFNEPGNNANLKVYTDEVKNIILPDGMVSGVIE